MRYIKDEHGYKAIFDEKTGYTIRVGSNGDNPSWKEKGPEEQIDIINKLVGNYSGMRQTWGLLNPATRTAPNGKAYDRNKEKQVRRRTDRKFSDEFDAGSFILAVQ